MEDLVAKQDGYQCPFLNQCNFIQVQAEKMPELIGRIQENYCTCKTAQCARRWLYEKVGAGAVPALMLPAQMDWAKQIAEEFGSRTKSAKKTPTHS